MMETVTRITPEQSRRVNALIRKECCNCLNDNCLLLDDEEPCTCAQLITYSGLYCNYFKKAVLPADKELAAEIFSNDKKRCKECKALFVPTAKNQQYCKICAANRNRRNAAERQRQKRGRMSRFLN